MFPFMKHFEYMICIWRWSWQLFKNTTTVREFAPGRALNYEILEDYVYWTMSYGAIYGCGPKGCKNYQKIWQEDHLNHSIYNLLRWNEMKNAKARPQDLLVINRNSLVIIGSQRLVTSFFFFFLIYSYEYLTIMLWCIVCKESSHFYDLFSIAYIVGPQYFASKS